MQTMCPICMYTHDDNMFVVYACARYWKCIINLYCTVICSACLFLDGEQTSHLLCFRIPVCIHALCICILHPSMGIDFSLHALTYTAACAHTSRAMFLVRYNWSPPTST